MDNSILTNTGGGVVSEYSMAGATPEWEAFVASLDPVEIERERFGTPHGERPGSAGWRRMVTEHDAQVAMWKLRRVRATAFEIGQACAESIAWQRRHEKALNEKHMRVAMVALANTEGNAA